jgi:hypothetical protein
MKKVVFTSTLNVIRKNSPCESGWRKLLAHLGKTKIDDEPINLLTILESNGVQDMCWALQCVEHPDLEKIARLMACDFAAAVLPLYEKKYPKDKRPAEAIRVARRYANGKATNEERAAAGAAARDAAWDAAGAAARDAAGAAARAAACAAACAAARDAAWAAAWAAAGAAAGAAARAAARDAAGAAAWDAAWAAARDDQAKIIKKYLTPTGVER